MQRTLNKPLIFLATITSLSIVGALSTHSFAQGRQAQQAQGKIVPTYYVDIKPILEKNCVSCHVTGGIAPFALDNPTDAVQWADRIAQVTKSGESQKTCGKNRRFSACLERKW
jgi:cytochrome c5